MAAGTSSRQLLLRSSLQSRSPPGASAACHRRFLTEPSPPWVCVGGVPSGERSRGPGTRASFKGARLVTAGKHGAGSDPSQEGLRAGAAPPSLSAALAFTLSPGTRWTRTHHTGHTVGHEGRGKRGRVPGGLGPTSCRGHTPRLRSGDSIKTDAPLLPRRSSLTPLGLGGRGGTGQGEVRERPRRDGERGRGERPRRGRHHARCAQRPGEGKHPG